MFSPIFATSARRRSSMLSPDGSFASPSPARLAGCEVRAQSATACAKARKPCSRATKSVSQLISTMAAVRASADLGTTPPALGGQPRRFLVGLGVPLLAHELGRGVQVTLGFDEGFLALHHARPGALAELLDCLCGDVHGEAIVPCITRPNRRPRRPGPCGGPARQPACAPPPRAPGPWPRQPQAPPPPPPPRGPPPRWRAPRPQRPAP